MGVFNPPYEIIVYKALFCVVEITTFNIINNLENLIFRTIGTLL